MNAENEAMGLAGMISLCILVLIFILRPDPDEGAVKRFGPGAPVEKCSAWNEFFKVC